MSARSDDDVRTVDCLGKACPVPVLDLANAVAGMAVGEEVVLVADDPGATVDIPVWCRMRSQQLLDVAATGSAWRFRVRKAR